MSYSTCTINSLCKKIQENSQRWLKEKHLYCSTHLCGCCYNVYVMYKVWLQFRYKIIISYQHVECLKGLAVDVPLY